MSVVQAGIQTVEDIYRLVWTAVASKKPIDAIYDKRLRLFCPHRLGRNRAGELRVLCYQYGGESKSGLEAAGFPSNWRCTALEKFSRVKLLEDAWRTAPNHSRPAACVIDATSMPRIIPRVTRRKDSEGVAREGAEQSSFLALRWSSGYAARGERGDPRGRKPGGGCGVDNPTWPARAEGEKRFRSATRNP